MLEVRAGWPCGLSSGQRGMHNDETQDAKESKSCVQAIPENKGREAKVRGTCIAKRRRGYRTSFTLLNHVPGGGPVERSFPL